MSSGHCPLTKTVEKFVDSTHKAICDLNRIILVCYHWVLALSVAPVLSMHFHAQNSSALHSIFMHWDSQSGTDEILTWTIFHLFASEVQPCEKEKWTKKIRSLRMGKVPNKIDELNICAVKLKHQLYSDIAFSLSLLFSCSLAALFPALI